MGNKISRVKVTREAPFTYRIESKDLTSENGEIKRRGMIYATGGEVLTVPFKKGNSASRKGITVRESEDKRGELKLSAARQKITLKITFDREKDSPEEFKRVFDEIIDGYTTEVIKKEIEQCLELDTQHQQ